MEVYFWTFPFTIFFKRSLKRVFLVFFYMKAFFASTVYTFLAIDSLCSCSGATTWMATALWTLVCATTFAVKYGGVWEAVAFKHDFNLLLVVNNFDGELVCCRVSVASEEEVGEVVFRVAFYKHFTACLGDFICAVFDVALTNHVCTQHVAKERDDHVVIDGFFQF